MQLSRAAATLVGPAAIALVLAPFAAGSAGAASAGASGHTKVVANCLKAKYEPKKIILTCADANSDLSHITYATWAARRATGNATLDFNNCKPNCAAGTWKHVPVTLVLKRVGTENGVKVFTVAVVDRNGHKRRYSPGI